MLVENADEPYAEEITKEVIKEGGARDCHHNGFEGDHSGSAFLPAGKGAERSGKEILPESFSGASH